MTPPSPRRVTLSLSLLILGLSVACGKGEEGASKAESTSPMVAELQALADRGCACADGPCADKVVADVTAFAKSITDVAEADMAPMQAAQARLDSCVVKYNEHVIAYDKLTTEVCACADAGCAKKSAEGFAAWSTKLKSSKASLSPGHVEHITALGKRAADCFKKHGVAIPR